MKKGVLYQSRAYLAGPIDLADNSVNWRPPIKDFLANELGIKIFDPFDDPKQRNVSDIYDHAKAGEFEAVRSIVKSFVRADLSVVNHSDFVIAHLPYKVPTTGTVHEIINANNAKKPTLLVCPQGKENLPKWFFGFVPLRFMFGSWDDLYSYLREVNEGGHADDDRWWFLHNYHDCEWLR